MNPEAAMYSVPMFYVWIGCALLWGMAIGCRIGWSLR